MKEICKFELKLNRFFRDRANVVGVVKQKYTFYEVRIITTKNDYKKKFQSKKKAIAHLMHELGTVRILTTTLHGNDSEKTYSIFRDVLLFNDEEKPFEARENHKYILLISHIHKENRAEVLFEIHEDEKYAYDMVCCFYKTLEYVRKNGDVVVEYCGNFISSKDGLIEIE